MSRVPKSCPQWSVSPRRGSFWLARKRVTSCCCYPERTVRSIKRRMGQAETVRMAGHDYTPQEISAIILKRLKEIGERRLGRPVVKAVITVPAYFSDTQRQATREAGEIAGLEVVSIINEPTAAALVYEAGQHQGKQILVYELGRRYRSTYGGADRGGGCRGYIERGNNHLGGDDFDRKIVAHVLDLLRLKPGVDVFDKPRAMARILGAAEAAKKHPSDHPYVWIEEGAWPRWASSRSTCRWNSCAISTSR